MQIREVKATRILNPTSIDLGDFVINPYKGCSYACLYCYVRFNKVTVKETRKWGEYVDVRANAPELLEKEIKRRKPERVLLGSTTECFGPYEERWGITGTIVSMLNRHGIYYSILTRSPIIRNYTGELKAGFCEGIYFTVNRYDEGLKALLEPRSPAFTDRIAAVNELLSEGVPVTPYCSPVLPYLTRIDEVFRSFPEARRIDCEGLNFNLGNIEELITAVGATDPGTGEIYRKMKNNASLYEKVWYAIKKDIMRAAIQYKKNHDVYIHGLSSYFENRYRTGSTKRG